MSKRLKIRKNGQRVYEIRVSRGRDPLTGKQLTPYQMTWKVPEAYSAKVAEREAGKVEGEFIAACKAGKVLTKQEEIQRRKQESKQAELERLEQESKPTFSEYMIAYLKKREAEGLAAGTLESYRSTLSKAAAIFGTMKMEDISKNMIREYMANLLKTGGYKHSTYTRYHATVKVFFESAVEDAVISVSPMAELKRPRKPKDEKATERADMKAYDEKQIANIFQQLDNEPLKWKTLIFFMLDTGCRRGDDDDKIRLNQRKPSKYKGLRRFGPEKNLQRINKFMKERPIFYKNLIQMKENIRFYLRCFYCITKVMILQFNSENRTELARNG